MKNLLDILYDATDRSDIVLADVNGRHHAFTKLAVMPIGSDHYAVLLPRTGQPVAFRVGQDDSMILLTDRSALDRVNTELSKLLNTRR